MQSLVDGATANRIAIVRAVIDDVYQLKAIPGLNARYVYIKPPSIRTARARIAIPQLETGAVRFREPLRQVLAQIGCTDEALGEGAAEAEGAGIAGFYDLILSSENMDEMYQLLLALVYA